MPTKNTICHNTIISPSCHMIQGKDNSSRDQTKMNILFYTFNEMKFSGFWNHSDFIILVTVYQSQNSHSSNSPGFRGKTWNIIYVLYFSISVSLRLNHLCLKKKKKMTDSALVSSIYMCVLRFQLPTKEEAEK